MPILSIYNKGIVLSYIVVNSKYLQTCSSFIAKPTAKEILGLLVHVKRLFSSLLFLVNKLQLNCSFAHVDNHLF